MEYRLQKKKLERLTLLLSQDLGYIWGEKECGPNGAKKEFLRVGVAFLKALGNDLGLDNIKVRKNPSGIAVCGDVYLYGDWGPGNGFFATLTQAWDFPYRPELLFRSLRDINNSASGTNCYIDDAVFRDADYDAMLRALRFCKERGEYRKARSEVPDERAA